jgi:hypothetical protein
VRSASKSEGWAPTAAFIVGATALHAALFATVALTRRAVTPPTSVARSIEYDVTLAPPSPPDNDAAPQTDVAPASTSPKTSVASARHTTHARITRAVAPSTETVARAVAASTETVAQGSAESVPLPDAPAALASSDGVAGGTDGEGRAHGSEAHGAGAAPAYSPPNDVHRHGPRLTASEACRRLFPHEARDDKGTVVVALRVGESGAVYEPRVLTEQPPRQGFARAALGCASLLRFEPAESAPGARIASVSVVRLRFARADLADRRD